jgi:light-regulated signal transduction histidine kinase (bacteriophytochrome)
MHDRRDMTSAHIEDPLPGEAAAGIDRQAEDIHVQGGGFLLELTADWLILRASENIHAFLGKYPATLIGAPLAGFTRAQPLHDLRNSLSRQRSHTGIARAYRIPLADGARPHDMAFQLVEGRILLEAVPSAEGGVGDALGSVSRLIDGLAPSGRQPMLDGAARRMRALTGFDRVALTIAGERVESSRSQCEPRPAADVRALPAIISDTSTKPVALFPRSPEDLAVRSALLRSPPTAQLDAVRNAGIRSMLNIPLVQGGDTIGAFECDNFTVRTTPIELHAAAELFAQVVAMRLDGSSA